MKLVVTSILSFIGAVVTGHFIFEYLYSLRSGNGDILLTFSRFGIYVIISFVFAFFRATLGMQEKDDLLNR